MAHPSRTTIRPSLGKAPTPTPSYPDKYLPLFPAQPTPLPSDDGFDVPLGTVRPQKAARNRADINTRQQQQRHGSKQRGKLPSQASVHLTTHTVETGLKQLRTAGRLAGGVVVWEVSWPCSSKI
ncbi:hypothetical protein Vretifemale_16604 [Volvox reticuliferus]|uniref:Uncharacterized protein n=1 Tax=Volvox reticuliferus TaxID=1737510 RepID=A0A8J4FVM5_9CHLO|nr:hypothetical protein Vretifemale_16604 [Volvox reticuliferus]